MKFSPILLFAFGVALVSSLSSFAANLSDNDPLKLLAFLEKDPLAMPADSSMAHLMASEPRQQRKEVLAMEIEDFKNGFQNLKNMATSFGAVKMSEFAQTSPELLIVSFKVPVEQLSAFLAAAENLTTVMVNQGSSYSDLTSELLEIETRLNAKARSHDLLVSYFNKAKTSSEKLDLQRAMLVWEEENAALLSRKQYWEELLKYAIVEITLTPALSSEGAAADSDDNSFYGAFKSGLTNTAELLKSIIRYWPLVLLGMGLTAFLVLNAARNRRKAESRHRDMMFLLQAQQNKF